MTTGGTLMLTDVDVEELETDVDVEELETDVDELELELDELLDELEENGPLQSTSSPNGG